MNHKIYDISLPLTAQTKVYPGDSPLHSTFIKSINEGDICNLSEFSCTTHLGTHIDSPLHYFKDEKPVGNLDLDLFIGECLLVKLKSKNNCIIFPEELIEYPNLPERILLNLMPENKYDKWINSYRFLSIELVDYLYNKGVKLIGVDTPSVDSFDSVNAKVHKRILGYDMIIIENLYLDIVPEGTYELIALPLKFINLEASPVRAILRTS